MKRSEINAIMRDALAFLQQCRFALPPFAHWSPQDWAGKGPECDEIRRRMLGWDITDFGTGDFARRGILLFTIRNGDSADPTGTKPYCEKIIIARPGQVCPMHFHWSKVEDIINRAGADLVLRLHAADARESVDAAAPVDVSIDGTALRLEAGGTVRLRPGESICLTQRLYHEFWAEGGPVLIGEVSCVNDDKTDNRFAEALGRFPAIEEDEPPLHLLCNEYPPARA